MTTRDTVTVIRNLVGDQFLYAYSPGDGRTRYVFTDCTKMGRAAALKHAELMVTKDVAAQVTGKVIP